MTVRIRFAVALVGLSGAVLSLAPVFGTPWPGVVLAGLSLVPLALEAWLERGGANSKAQLATLDGQTAFLNEAVMTLSARLKEADARAVDQQQQINSLRNAASLRGTLGG